MDRDRMEQGIRLFLEGVGQRFEGDDLEKTPRRVAKAWAEDLLGGSDPVVRSFSAKVSVSGVGEVVNLLNIGGCLGICTSANPDSISRPPDLYNEHSCFRFALFNVMCIHLSDTCGKHNRLEPLIAVTIRHTNAE